MAENEVSSGENTHSAAENEEKEEEKKPAHCELCEWLNRRLPNKDRPNVEAEWFCKDCAQRLCSGCRSLHTMESYRCKPDRMVNIEEISCEADTSTSTDSRDIKMRKQHSRDVRTADIRGVTVVDDKLFVVRDRQSQIRVFDLERLAHLQDIDVPGMKMPHGVAGCSHLKVLYVSDTALRSIHRVNITDGSIKRWVMPSIYNIYWPYDVSLTSERNIFITVRVSVQSRVVEYTSDGQLIRDIELDGSIMHALQTVQLSSDRLVVCHGMDPISLHRICLINGAGKIIKSYGRESGRGEGQLDNPCSLTTDNNSKLLFVGDCINNRILMFDFDLTYLGLVNTPRDLWRPTCVYFDSSTDRLIVGEEITGRVAVVNREFFSVPVL